MSIRIVFAASAALLFISGETRAQDVPGIEICTVEKTMERRTSCLQSNVDFLQKTISKLSADHAQKFDAANRQIESLKTRGRRPAEARRRSAGRAEQDSRRPEEKGRRAGGKGCGASGEGGREIVRHYERKRSNPPCDKASVDCFVASLLAMTGGTAPSRHAVPLHHFPVRHVAEAGPLRHFDKAIRIGIDAAAPKAGGALHVEDLDQAVMA